MTSAQAALVDQELITALNELRIKHVDAWGRSLDQIRFRARGLKRHPPENLAMQAMIAVLDGDKDVVRASAEGMGDYPNEFDCRLNVLRSLSAMMMGEEAAAYAGDLCRDFPNGYVVDIAVACLSNAGAIEAAHDLAASWFESGGRVDEEYGGGRVFDLFEAIQAMISVGIGDAEFSGLLTDCRALLAAQGWPTAGLAISPIVAASEEGAPLALIEFFIDTENDHERSLDVEDAVMEGLVDNALFSNLRCVVAVVPEVHSESNELKELA